MVRIDEVQKLGKDNMDATLKSFGAFSKSLQAITVEIADFSKKVFEQNPAATERLIGAKSLEKAILPFAPGNVARALPAVESAKSAATAAAAPTSTPRRRGRWLLLI